MRQIDPIFEIGPIPALPHCTIQKREWDGEQWKYAIHNSYNPWTSGWATEDFIVSEIYANKPPAATN